MSKTNLSMQNELYTYKQNVISQILENADIVNALCADVESSELLYRNIFPFGVISPTQSDAKCMITVEVTMPQVSTVNYFFKDVLLVINVICHNDLMRTDYGIPRHDYVSAKICEMLDGDTDIVGLGELKLVSNTEGAYGERHSGRTMRFQSSEQGRTLCN